MEFVKQHRSKRILLRQIRFKPSDITDGTEFGLGAIQLVFTEGFQTPFFQAAGQKEKEYPVKTIKVPKKAAIAKIGIFWF